MSTPIDDLRRGDWIAMVGFRGEQEESPFGRQQVRFDGSPLRVLEISLPFLAVCDGQGRTFSVDVRDWAVQRVSDRYAEVLHQTQGALREQNKGRLRRRRRRREKPDPLLCPRCGDRLRQFMSRSTDYRFRFVCPTCGFDSGPVLKEE